MLNRMTIKFMFLIILVFIKVTISMKTVVPLLNENVSRGKVSWTLTKTAEDKLSKFEDKTFHAVAVGGPTRAGKSFIIGHILTRLEKLGGRRHFGEFVHRSTTESVTKGMDIALVEYKGKFILLIDCEGLKSASKPMDPKLMLIMSMISQKMIYLTKNVDINMVNDISSMIVNLKQIDLGTGSKIMNLPLNSLYVVLNQTEFEGEARNEQFLEDNLTTKNKNVFNGLFPNRKLIFITEKPKNEEDCSDKQEFDELTELFNSDILNIFDKLINDLPSFTFGGKTTTIGEFMSYLNNNVLTPINNNKKICFPDLVGEIFKSYAERVIDDMPGVDRLPWNSWINQYRIDDQVEEIRDLKNIFDNKTFTYREHVVDIRNNFFRELENDIYEIERTNRQHGCKIVKSDHQRWEDRIEYNGYTTNGGWFSWTEVKYHHYTRYYKNRTKYTYADGDVTYSGTTETSETYSN